MFQHSGGADGDATGEADTDSTGEPALGEPAPLPSPVHVYFRSPSPEFFEQVPDAQSESCLQQQPSSWFAAPFVSKSFLLLLQ